MNLIENIVHYNIGKYTNQNTQFDLPTRKDWVKIVAVMVAFAVIQGSFTCLLYNRCK